MADITWTPEGETIFNKLVDAVPEPMRETIKPKLLEMISARAAGAPVTDTVVEAMVKEDLPEPQRSALMAALGIADAAQEQAAQTDQGPALDWTDKSEVMFEIMLGEVPEAMREVFRGKLTGVIVEKTKGSPVAEDDVTAVVNEVVPEPFKSNILKKFKELGDFDISVIDTIIERNGTSQDSLMYTLHDVQDEIGYLPKEALIAIGNKTGINISIIYNVVTFYKAFKLEAPGQHHVKVCCGTACHLHDTDGIAQDIEASVDSSNTTTMEKTLCLGCCDSGPVIEIDGKVFTGNEAKQKVDTLVSK